MSYGVILCWIFLSIKNWGIQSGNPYPYPWYRSSLMARDSGSAATTISQAQRRSNRANRGCNGRDVQLGQLGERLTAPTRVAKKRFAPDEGIQLEVNARAPAPKKRRTRKVSPLFQQPGDSNLTDPRLTPTNLSLRISRHVSNPQPQPKRIPTNRSLQTTHRRHIGNPQLQSKITATVFLLLNRSNAQSLQSRAKDVHEAPVHSSSHHLSCNPFR